jgi:hypothetical protein
MIKRWLIKQGLKVLMGAIALGIGVWYLSNSIGGASLSYTSVDAFMQQIGAADGDVSSVNGCFLCSYISNLFAVLGRATEMFWNGIVHNLWILMAVGFGVFIVSHTLQFLNEQAKSKEIKDLSDKEIKLDFKKWFEKVWKTGARVLIAGALIGALSWSGTSTLKVVTNVTVSPVMYLGSTLSMMATGVISGATCEIPEMTNRSEDILNPVLHPFMCVIGNLNTVMLAGAGGGFALMNYSWLDLNDRVGGVFTWIAGLTLVILFLVIGFNLLFQILTVFFKLIFIIIFMPLLIAAAAFEQVWGLAKGLINSAVDKLLNSVIDILKISLKITIIYAIVYFAADQYYPGPEDNFTTILPPLTSTIKPENMDAKTMSVMNVFSTCERVSLVDGEMDKEKFKACFRTQKNLVEQRYPGAFDFMDDGFDFFLFMLGVFILFFWVVSPQIDKLIGSTSKEPFDYGKWVKDFGTTVYNAPVNIYNKVREKREEEK